MVSKNPTSKSSSSEPVDLKTIEAQVVAAITQLLASPGDTPSIHGVAALLQIQVRTLQRRLGSSGLQFRTLLSDCQRRQALRDLGSADLHVKDVASRLGYSDPAHFARAFRRWTGRSPIEIRSRLLELDSETDSKPNTPSS